METGGAEPITGEKRKLPEALTLEDAKRIRVMGDIPMELVNEVMMTITDPAAMLGPEVAAWLWLAFLEPFLLLYMEFSQLAHFFH